MHPSAHYHEQGFIQGVPGEIFPKFPPQRPDLSLSKKENVSTGRWSTCQFIKIWAICCVRYSSQTGFPFMPECGVEGPSSWLRFPHEGTPLLLQPPPWASDKWPNTSTTYFNQISPPQEKILTSTSTLKNFTTSFYFCPNLFQLYIEEQFCCFHAL